MDDETVDYFKSLAEDLAMPYQTLINLYLRDCAQNRKQLKVEWKNQTKGA